MMDLAKQHGFDSRLPVIPECGIGGRQLNML